MSPAVRRAAPLAALVGLICVAVVLWMAPRRRAQELETASLARLQQLQKESPDDTAVLTTLGVRLREAGQPAAAAEVLKKVAPRVPDDGRVWGALAEALADTGDRQAAQTALDAFLKRQPSDPDAQLALGRLYRRDRNWPKAYQAAREATRLGPNSALAWHLLGQAAGQTGHTDEAAKAYRKAYELDPKRWETALGRGEVELQAERYAEAVSFFREASQRAPDQALPALSLGQALLKASNAPSPEALEALTRAARLRPDIPQVQLNLGRALARTGDLDRAIKRVELARDLAPELPETQQELGRLYRQRGRQADSDQAFARNRLLLNLSQENRVIIDRVAVAGPDTVEGRRLQLQMARRLAGAGLYDNATKIYQSILSYKADPQIRAEVAAMEARRDREDPPLERGDRLVKVRLFSRALVAYQRALKADPKSARAWEGAGLALASLGNTEGALPGLLKAVHLDRNRLMARTALGEVCYVAAFPSAAVRWLRPAAKEPAALHLIGLALAALSDPTAASSLAEAARLAPDNPEFRRDADAARDGTLKAVGAALGADDAKAQAAPGAPATHVVLARAAQKAGLDVRAYVEFTLAQMLGDKDPAVDKERTALGERMSKAGELPSQDMVESLAIASMPEDFKP